MSDIVDVIKFEGDNSTFVWKSPIEDFKTGSQLIVHESQEAIFFMNGQALDLFGPGRHTLTTQNIPLLGKLLNLPVKGNTPFHCKIYFINKTEQMGIKWGTDSLVQYTDPIQNFPLKIGASGEMSVVAEDARKLLIKVVGTESVLSQDQMVSKVRAFLMAKVKPYLADVMTSQKISIFDVDSKMEEISGVLHERLGPYFRDYGLSLERFFVTTVVKPEDDPVYMKFLQIVNAKLQQQVDVIDQQTESIKMGIESEALAKKRQTEGYSYHQEQAYEVSKLAAQNEGAGNFSSAGIGLGMMGGIAGGMGGTIAGITTNAMSQVNEATQSPQNQAPQDEMAELKLKIEKLKMMKDSGLLSEEEWDAERKKLLGNL